LDLLQEIGKEIGRRVQAQVDKAWGKVADMAYETTLGLLKQYQQKALQLVRIQAAQLYAQALKVARKHLLLLCVMLFGTMVSAIALVVIPVTLVLLAPWSTAIKVVCLLVLGSSYIAGTAWIFLVLFSEDKWMKFSGMDQLLDQIAEEDHRF
jgi:hypothetical protein